MASLIVFAAYWNEQAFIDASLDQIEALQPEEAVICDGCFDPRLPVHSTDGTWERIVEFAQERNWVQLVSPVRRSRLWHMAKLLRRLPLEESSDLIARARLLRVGRGNHVYRLNQAATFNLMIQRSSSYRAGSWVMTLDADEYYSDATIERFRRLGVDDPGPARPVRERTMVGSPRREATDYPGRLLRTWNVPVKIPESGIRFFPTRVILSREGVRKARHRLVPAVPEVAVADSIVGPRYPDEVFHYKNMNGARTALAYSLGDRRPPSEARLATVPFEGVHPSIVQRHFLDGGGTWSSL